MFSFVPLVRRRFVAGAPSRLWLTDITEHPTREGKVYLAAVRWRSPTFELQAA